ncbi:MAG: phosphoribosylformylglycinamidine synthase subunit PurS [Defluviitaleaceae bacterium]|nr:phosphoribosylformylglycinamidine synthase subunit PurS [Defluviitaleaceae bacterium]MCL2263231.1 phosphoribosylformylglycinamidine synthase subunit PurS [Defluviitaleaceae bacterium]
MYKVKVYVTLRESILDPQGKAVTGGLHKLGFEEVREVRIGKFIEMTIDGAENIEERVKQMCGKLLANEVMEDFRYEIEKVQS